MITCRLEFITLGLFALPGPCVMRRDIWPQHQTSRLDLWKSMTHPSCKWHPDRDVAWLSWQKYHAWSPRRVQ